MREPRQRKKMPTGRVVPEDRGNLELRSAITMASDFEAAREWFLEGIAHFQINDFARAEDCFLASLARAPGRVSTLVNLGATRLKLGRPTDALQSLDEAVGLRADDADAWSHRGVALGDLGRADEAVASHGRALELDPGRATDLFHRGLARNVRGRHDEALRDFASVLALKPADGEAWFRHGQTLQLLDRHDEALASYDKALASDPGHAQAWSNRGGILRDMKRLAEAADCYEQALAHGADEALHRYFLAAVRDGPAPAQPPGPYVESLFDHYAEDFDAHLLQALRYQAHAVLVDGLAGLASRWFVHALDLGCGTGLCGPLVKPRVERLDGVDLSGAMLDKARALGVYTELTRSDLVEHLRSTPARHDLVLAADVFIYIGDLVPVFEGVSRVLQPQGVFCFSVELAGGGDDFELRPSLRYAHSERFVRRLAESHGLALRQCLRQPIREEQGAPIDGLFVYLEKR